MAERGLSVDHSTVHRWVVHFAPKLLERFNRRKRSVTGKWHMDETYSKVRGQWMYLYRAIDSVGDPPRRSLAGRIDPRHSDRRDGRCPGGLQSASTAR